MLPDSVSKPREFCFGPPPSEPGLIAHRQLVPRLAIASSTLDGTQILAGLNDGTATALANVLPCLLCGEESAVIVFANEGNRIASSLHDDASDTLFRISAEEEYHEEMLASLQARLPEARELERRKQLARRYFRRIHSRDIGEHFARIAALDSAVCIILGEMHRPGGPFPPDSLAAAIFSRIRHDEGRHVRFSRRYAAALGVTRDGAAESFEVVRSGLVGLLRLCGNGFDSLAVDPDRLFRRLTAVPPGLV